MMFLMHGDIDALYDNSKPFSTFLMKEGLEDILRETKLKLREKHTIVPHVCSYAFPLYYYLFAFSADFVLLMQRDMVSLKATPNALPEFSDDDSWYYYVRYS
jgi:hypothetical protein